jgi:hypothetical protein
MMDYKKDYRTTCSECGQEVPIHYHHQGYGSWRCDDCHLSGSYSCWPDCTEKEEGTTTLKSRHLVCRDRGSSAVIANVYVYWDGSKGEFPIRHILSRREALAISNRYKLEITIDDNVKTRYRRPKGYAPELCEGESGPAYCNIYYVANLSPKQREGLEHHWDLPIAYPYVVGYCRVSHEVYALSAHFSREAAEKSRERLCKKLAGRLKIYKLVTNEPQVTAAEHVTKQDDKSMEGTEGTHEHFITTLRRHFDVGN